MDRFGKLVRIFGRNRLVIEREQFPVAILFENGAENPAMTVIIGELRVFHFWIKFGDFLNEIEIPPESASGGGLRILADRGHELFVGGVLLFLWVHELAV